MSYQFNTLQANHGMQGNYSAGIEIPGHGLGIYVGVLGNVEILTVAGETVMYTAVPQGTFMQVPLFKEITSGTTSTDIAVSYMAPPYR